MEVKLSISSSRRISFASDFKDFDLEVERKSFSYDNDDNERRFSDDLDDDDFGYVRNYFLCKNSISA
jgi:hypothetical protein